MTNKSEFTFQGDSLESFYQFGLSEKEDPSSSDIIKKIIFKNKSISLLIEKILGNTLSFPKFLRRELQQYIEGKGIATDLFIQNFYLPDILSLITSISPNSVPSIACSSALVNNGSSIKHLRILDYPLGPFSNQFEKKLCFNLKGFNKVYALSFTDLPLPSITSFNDQGISLALHQRTTNKVNYKGSSILELTAEMILTSKSIDDALKLAQNFKAINNWSIILVSEKEKFGAEIEVVPFCEPIIKKFNLSMSDTFIYICNKSLDVPDSKNENPSFTDNWNFYNSSRKNWISNISQDEKEDRFFKLPKLKTTSPFSHYPVTPASIQSLEINLTKKEIKSHSKGMVKFYDGQFTQTKINWDSLELQSIEKLLKKTTLSSLENFYELVSLCQFFWDQNDNNKAFHYAQACVDQAPSRSLKAISTLFYSYFVFCELDGSIVLSNQLKKLQDIKKMIPSFLQSDSLLIENYYCFYLGLPQINLDKLETPHYNQFQKNKKIPKFLLKKIFKHIYISRFEMFSFGKINYLIDAVGSP